ncbi:mbre TPR repeat protein [Achlya hypogyna]|uniref:Mbre TPR repeat protein n=1 Tax=Achlya hypogyna TaxID=1202772 RepID=A0A1V9YF64_ACHHY|nr:mbre TPR repeat protein [Achlya hypogyna]
MCAPLGVRLSYFRRFIELHGGRQAFAGKTSAQVCFEYVVPYTKSSGLSLVDHVRLRTTDAESVQPATWYISHAWSYVFLETLDSLESFFAGGPEPVVWFCVFNNNQHEAASYPFEWWQTTFQSSLAAIGNVVMIMHPWKNPATLTRSWCIFEVYVAITVGATFDVALASNQEDQFLDDMVEDISAFHSMLATVSSERAQATVPSDKINIDSVIKAEVGFLGLDRLVFDTIKTWMLARLEQRVELAASLVEKAKYMKALAEFQGLLTHFTVAESLANEALQLYLESYGPLHADTLFVQGLVAVFRGFQYKPREDWEPVLLNVIDNLTTVVGPDHELTLNCMMQLGNLYVDILGMPDEALTLLGETLRRMRNVFGADHERTIACQMAYTLTEAGQDEYDVAVSKVTACITDVTRALGPHHPTSLAGPALE